MQQIPYASERQLPAFTQKHATPERPRLRPIGHRSRAFWLLFISPNKVRHSLAGFGAEKELSDDEGVRARGHTHENPPRRG